MAMTFSRRNFLAAGAVALASSLVHGQAYPTRPIRLVIPFPPGGAFDAVGRPWAERAKAGLSSVVVENIGGGGSSIGASAVARAKPDGYTILLGGTQTHVNEALLKTKPLYDPVKDLEPIAGVVFYPLCFVVHPTLPAKNLKELVALARANPGSFSYGHAGLGSIQHLTGELFKSLAKAPGIVQVPYRGTGPALTDVMGGQIPVAVLGLTGQVIELHRAGRLRVLAVTSPARLKAAPEFATAVEQGYPAMNVRGSIGILAPAGTPAPIIERVAQASRTALADKAWQQQLHEAGMEPTLDSNAEQFRKSLAGDIALWAPVVKAVGVKVD